MHVSGKNMHKHVDKSVPITASDLLTLGYTTVVHTTAGSSAFASLFMVGSRRYFSDEERLRLQIPHNRVLVMLGTGMVWFAWFGLCGGASLTAGGQSAFAITNMVGTFLSPSLKLVVRLRRSLFGSLARVQMHCALAMLRGIERTAVPEA
jgi:hypothetical protein